MISNAVRTLLWLSEQEPGAEYVVVWQTPQGYRVHGDLVGSANGAPCRAWYQLDLDATWGVRRLRAAWSSATALTRLHLQRDAGGGWQVNGRPRPDLSTCVDIDLEWSPLTNSLPIRRLDFAVGDQRELTMAYIAAAELTVTPDGQRYTRLAAQR